MDVSWAWQVFVTGIAILAAAIVVNLPAQIAGISTWYGFINSINKTGLLSALKTESVVSLLFLFIIYPYLLGLTGFFITKWSLK